MRTGETCDVCGGEISGDAIRAELSIEEMMCPTPMSFHPACYEQASVLWQPDTESICVVDPDYPETQTWTPRVTS
ncbi:MAG: hypothetical protein ACRDJ4_07695 [Actinomycetota bacterium]